MFSFLETHRFRGLLICLGLSLATGALFYRVMAIPFGWLFNTCLGLLAASIVSLLLQLTLLCIRIKRRWLSFLGVVPALLATFLGIAVVLFIFDVRRLWFMGFPPKPNAAAWAADFHVLAERLKTKPSNLTHRVSAEVLDKTVHEIETALPGMSEAQITLALCRLSALSQDAHSMPFLFLPCFDLHGFPIRVFRFEEGWFVVDAGRSQRSLIGSRITKIGTMEVEEVFRRLPDHLGVENGWGRLDRGNWLLCSEWLQSIGAVEDSQQTMFTLEAPQGETFRVNLPTVDLAKILVWQNLFTLPNGSSPVFTNPRQEWYRFELQDKTKTLLVQFHKVGNQPRKETLAAFSARLSDFATTHSFERCVVDLRLNEGGDDWLSTKLLATLRDNPRINRTGRLFVLIGRHTFSSGVLFAHQLRLQTKAIFVGEGTSQGPQFDANPKLVTLPNSKLIFALSSSTTRDVQPPWPFQVESAILPDIPVRYTHQAFLEGRDAAMETVFSFTPLLRADQAYPGNRLEEVIGRYVMDPFRVLDIAQQGPSLVFTISDFIPRSIFQVRSELHSTGEGSFRSDIPGVELSIPMGAPFLTLRWMGQERRLPRALSGHAPALELLSTDRIDDAVLAIRKEKSLFLSGFPGIEGVLMTKGYSLLQRNRLPEALQVFRLGAELFPTSSDAHDSLGEALMKNGEREAAIKHYQKSVELNPENANGRAILKKFGREKR